MMGISFAGPLAQHIPPFFPVPELGVAKQKPLHQ